VVLSPLSVNVHWAIAGAGRDAVLCRQVGRLLQKYYGPNIEEIGSLDVSGML
jgi:hypothetical protein